MKTIFISLLAGSLLLLAGCGPSNDEKVTEFLKLKGYTKINILGQVKTSCSDDDYFRTGFIALEWAGQGKQKSVHGVVCSTIDFEHPTIEFRDLRGYDFKN